MNVPSMYDVVLGTSTLRHLSIHETNRISNMVYFFPNTHSYTYTYTTGGTWDADQELSQHPSAVTSSYSDDESGYFERLGARTETILEKYFTIWGTYCANNPWFILFLGK